MITTNNLTETVARVAGFAAAHGPVRTRQAINSLQIALDWPDPIQVPAAAITAVETCAAVLDRRPPESAAPTLADYLSADGDQQLDAYALARLLDAHRGPAKRTIELEALAAVRSAVAAAWPDIWERLNVSFADAFRTQLVRKLDLPDQISSTAYAKLTASARREVDEATHTLRVLAAARKLSDTVTRLPSGSSKVEQVVRYVEFNDYQHWSLFTHANRPNLTLKGPLLLELAKAGATPTLAADRAEVDRRVAHLDDTRRMNQATANSAARRQSAAARQMVPDLQSLQVRT